MNGQPWKMRAHAVVETNARASRLPGTMPPKDLSVFLLEAAQLLRELAFRAPDISNELRRLAEEVEFDAVQLGRKGQSREDAA
jgi:hypothetical protein